MKTVVAIVVNYNSGLWLERCVESILSSDYDVDLYVVDNASSDDSLHKIKSISHDLEKLHLIENLDNLGFAKANNIVLNTTSADYYVLINPDCIIEKETIGFLVDQMQLDQQVGLAGVRILNEDGTPQKTSKRRFPTPENTLVRVLGLSKLFKNKEKYSDFDYGDKFEATEISNHNNKQFVEAISGAFMMVSSDALNHVGGLDEGYFMHCEDLDWCKRFWLHGYKVAFYSEAVITHVKGKSSQARPYRVNWYLHKGMLRFYRKFYRKHYGKLISTAVYLGIIGRYAATNFKIFLSKTFSR